MANAVTTVKNGSIMINVVHLNDHAVNLTKGTKICTANRWSKQEVNEVSVEEKRPHAESTESAYRPLSEDEVNCGDSITHEKLMQLLNKYREVSWMEGEPLGKYSVDSLEIELKEDVVINKAPYHIPRAQQEQLDV